MQTLIGHATIINITPSNDDARKFIEALLKSTPDTAPPTAEDHHKPTITPPPLGQPWPGQGGVYAGLMRGEDGQPDYHLIVAIDPKGHNETTLWGSAGIDEPGATHERDGKANTDALNNSEHPHPAADWTASVEIDGHKDFYLPARRELRLAWVNAPEAFSPGWYLSSTQCSRNVAWCQGFDGGTQLSSDKAYEGRARAVRRFIAQ